MVYMRSHFANENYYNLNKSFTEKYLKNTEYKFKLYQNPQLALYDIAAGLQQFISHKGHFAVIKKGSSIIESLNPFWAKNFNPIQQKKDLQSWTDFISQLHAETNFVVWSSENEITGEVLVDESESQMIHQQLSQKRIFSIQICHHHDSHSVLSPYTIKIIRPSLFSKDQTLVLFTEKFRAPSLIGSYQEMQLSLNQDNFFDNVLEIDKIQQRKVKYHEFLSQIEQSTLRKNLVSETHSNIFDHIVFSFNDIQGAALAEILENDHSIAKEHLFTPSTLPFWVLDSWKNWWPAAEKSDYLRGLIVVSRDAFLNVVDLTEKIHSAALQLSKRGLVKLS